MKSKSLGTNRMSLHVAALIALCVFSLSSLAPAQQPIESDSPQFRTECTAELFDSAEYAYRRYAFNPYDAERKLAKIQEVCRNASLIPEISRRLALLHEARANQHFLIGEYYYQRFKTNGTGLKGAQSRFLEIVNKFKEYSGMDKTLFLLADTYLIENRFAESDRYFEQLIKDHPESGYAIRAMNKINNPKLPEQ